MALAGTCLGLTLIGAAILRARMSNEARPSPATMTFTHDGNGVAVAFLGEVPGTELFEDGILPTVRPTDINGLPVGTPFELAPSWLEFRYRINSTERRVLIAKQPLMNYVSWDAIARAGAALGDGSAALVGEEKYRQDASVRDIDGNRYRVRLPSCGHSTSAGLSEWNLLIGGVHVGDQDFTGERFGWVHPPYSDADLKVGYDGSLSWCRERWKRGSTKRVARGYFRVSRLHAVESELATDRLFWRPVLESEGTPPDASAVTLESGRGGELSPDMRVRFLGAVGNEELFGAQGRITDQVPFETGIHVEDGRPDWLHFELDGEPLLVAAKPVVAYLSWKAIARAGAVHGDGSTVRFNQGEHLQNTVVSDVSGNRYRVRLLKCGESTLDPDSEWNLLIGGIHEGDGDFHASRDGRYGWTRNPFSDEELHVGERLGSATWCQRRETIEDRSYAVNRGYLTVSRYHLTETAFQGAGFGWRPVLVPIRGQRPP